MEGLFSAGIGERPGTLLCRNIHRVRRLPRRHRNNIHRPAAREAGRHEYVYLIESRKRALRSRERDLRILPADGHSRIRGPRGAFQNFTIPKNGLCLGDLLGRMISTRISPYNQAAPSGSARHGLTFFGFARIRAAVVRSRTIESLHRVYRFTVSPNDSGPDSKRPAGLQASAIS